MKKRAKCSVSFLAMVLTFFCTACSNTGSNITDISGDTGATPADENNPVTLTTVSMYGGTDPNASNYQTIISKFMEDYPYITVEDDSQVSDQDWKTRIAADFAVGNEPDVIQYFTDANASDVLAADKFVTINEVRTEYPDYAKDTLPSALKAAANPDGIERAVPTTGYWEGLFCNKDLFKKYGLELPTTWFNMLRAIETFKENNIVPIAVSLNNVPHYLVEYLILSAAGPDSYRQIPKTVPKEWCEGLAMFKTLRDMGAFPKDTDTIDNDLAGELFKSKRAAMKVDGSWFLGSIPDQQNTVVVAYPVIPGGRARSTDMVGGISSGFYITKKAWLDTDKRDAAVKFVMANTSKEAVTKYWGGNGSAAVAADPIKNLTPLSRSGLKYSSEATSVSTPIDSRLSQEAYNTLIAGIVDISTGVKTPEELLKEVFAINVKQ